MDVGSERPGRIRFPICAKESVVRCRESSEGSILSSSRRERLHRGSSHSASARISNPPEFPFNSRLVSVLQHSFPTGGISMRSSVLVLAWVLALGATTAQAAIPTSERNVLLALYASTNGAG